MTYSSDGGSSAVQERYEGEWVDGKMQGRGTYQYSDGSVYDGGWVGGKMQGKGVFVYPNGNRYEGEFFVSSAVFADFSLFAHSHCCFTCSVAVWCRTTRKRVLACCNTKMANDTRYLISMHCE